MGNDTPLLRVDVGCGSNKKAGCIGIDCQPLECVDLVVDLTTEKIPLPDRSAEYIHSSHFFEHIKVPNNVFSEISRIAADGAILEIWTPYAYSDSAFCYGHEIFVTPEIWRHICVLYPDFYYPIINARWLLKKVVYVVNVDAYDEILKSGFDIEFAIRYFKGIVDEIGVFIEIRHSKVSSTTQPEQFYAFSRFDRKYRPFNSGENGRHGFLQTQQPINPHRVGLLQKTLHRLQGNKLWSTLKGICDR